MTAMDQHAVERIRKLSKDAQSDPAKAAQLRQQLKKYLDRQQRQKPKR